MLLHYSALSSESISALFEFVIQAREREGGENGGGRARLSSCVRSLNILTTLREQGACR